MKKPDNHPIDNFFKENVEQYFPYDPTLWKGAEKGMSFWFGKKRMLIFSIMFLFFISSIAVFFLDKPETKTDQFSKTKSLKNHVIVKEKATDQSNYFNENTNKSDADKRRDMDTKSSTKSSVFEKKLEVKTLTPPETEPLNKTKPNFKKEFEIKNEVNPIANVKLFQSIEPSIVNKKPEPNIPISEIKKFMDISILSKPITTFFYGNFNKNPELNLQKPNLQKPKFAIALEFENIYSVFLKQKLRIYDTAQKELLNYKNQFEKPQNSNGYSINLMLQKGRFGLITGLGYSTSGFKTNYITDTNHRHFIETTITRYRMIRDSVKYQGGYYSQIQEYQVSVYTPSALLKGETRKVNFNWIQIPLKVSYQYSLNRLRFSSRVGADFMWLYNLNGTFINQNLTAINTEEKLKKFNVNFSGQLLAGYQLNHNIQAGGSIYMNHQLGSNFVDYKSSFQSKGYGIYVRWGF